MTPDSIFTLPLMGQMAAPSDLSAPRAADLPVPDFSMFMTLESDAETGGELPPPPEGEDLLSIEEHEDTPEDVQTLPADTLPTPPEVSANAPLAKTLTDQSATTKPIPDATAPVAPTEIGHGVTPPHATTTIKETSARQPAHTTVPLTPIIPIAQPPQSPAREAIRPDKTPIDAPKQSSAAMNTPAPAIAPHVPNQTISPPLAPAVTSAVPPKHASGLAEALAPMPQGVEAPIVAPMHAHPLHRAAPHPVDARPADTAPIREIARQITAHLTPLEPGVTDIALSPEELGKLRMSVTTRDGAVSLVITAERPETADLMRRHAEQIQQDFRNAGMGNLNLSFQDRTPERQQTADLWVDTSNEPEAAEPRQASHQISLAPSDHLDLRL